MPMEAPRARAVVVPFGVPKESRGIGIGLAALVHGFTQLDGGSVALAQLTARRKGDATRNHASPVETFLPPSAWRDLSQSGDTPPGVTLVVTGSFEPPAVGAGHLQLLAFDARDGRTLSRVEAHLDGDHAGGALLDAFEEMWRSVGGELGVLRDLRDLPWEALESILLAERCALHDPARGGPHDRLAALMHLSRAVGDAPEAKFPAGRLAAIALEMALGSPVDAGIASAALRTLTRAAIDAPTQPEIFEACAALHLRLGSYEDAEKMALGAIERDASRGRVYALLSESRRARGDLAGAAAAAERGLDVTPDEAALYNELGMIRVAEGDLTAARAAWRAAQERDPTFPPAFANVADLALKDADPLAAQRLVDAALAARSAHPEVLRRAIFLALAAESEGLPRAARVAELARGLLARIPNDAWGAMMLGRSLAQLGEREEAIARLKSVETSARDGTLGAEAQRMRFSLEDPASALELEAVVRAALGATLADVPVIAARARRLAEQHAVWLAPYALGIAERRLGNWPGARRAFEAALVHSPGACPVRLELTGACIVLEDPQTAVTHAARARELEGDTPRGLGALAAAELAAGRGGDALATIQRAVELDPDDAANRALAAKIRVALRPPRSVVARLVRALVRKRG